MTEPLHRGSKIAVCVSDFTGHVVGVVQGRVMRKRRNRVRVRACGELPLLLPQERVALLFLSDEGSDWVRGWDTPEALAFRAEIALLVSE